MKSSSDPSHLVVGRLGRAVGLKGEVEVLVASDDPDRFAPGSRVLTAGELRPLTVRHVRHRKDRTIVAFEEVLDRTAAESLRGTELVVEAGEARRLGDDEYWDHDLLGCLVVTVEGDRIGRVHDVLHSPANDLLVVHGKSGEQLIPLIRDVLRSIEPGRMITIEPIPGLLD